MLSVSEVAKQCGVSQDAVRRAIRAGQLPATRVFNRVRISEQDLEQYIEAGRVGGGEVRRRRPAPRAHHQVPGSLRAIERKAA